MKMGLKRWIMEGEKSISLRKPLRAVTELSCWIWKVFEGWRGKELDWLRVLSELVCLFGVVFYFLKISILFCEITPELYILTDVTETDGDFCYLKNFLPLRCFPCEVDLINLTYVFSRLSENVLYK